jgi:ferric-dicitrate binding protein FerR (iron transport regulator)
METNNRNTNEIPDEYRLFVETIRRIRVSPQIAAMGEAMKDDIWMELQRRIANIRRRTFWQRTVSIAATVAVLLGITNYFSYRQGHRYTNPAIVEMTTPLGMQSSVILSDDTKVWLNAGTTLTYPVAFTDKNREVVISGEAFFEVTHDKKHPFIVHAEALDVRVLGTTFNVKAYPEEEVVEVTLETGRVKAGLKNQTMSYNMETGERLVFDKLLNTFQKGQVNTEYYDGWKDGKFYFETTTFEQIAKQLERRFNVQIHIASESLKKTTFTGDFVRQENLNQILRVMTINRQIHYKIEGDQVKIQEVKREVKK